MATVTLVFTDTLHGTVEISGEVDPPIEDGAERTPAQETGFQLLKGLLEVIDTMKFKQGRAVVSGSKN